MDTRDVPPIRRYAVVALLGFFAVWDLGLAALAVAWPDLWFRQMHGVPRVDPQALLARTGLIWAAFSLFHALAFLRWRKHPHWLVIVGGMRLSELFADLGYLLLAHDTTPAGRMALALAAPTNVLFAAFFIQTYLQVAAASLRRLADAQARVDLLERQLAEATVVPRPDCPPVLPVVKIVGEPLPAGAGPNS
ncbi:MAG TPA: hypothetical protein VJT67_08785 [Longimicrobiaceae bacterium]|nr:hypothetical protein [Longimicrobiaceae bacterium]